MREEINKVLGLMELSNKKCPFYKESNSKTFLDGLKDEIQESEAEIEIGNYEELEKELGDVFWDYINLLSKLEDEGKIKITNVFESIYDKISRRKSFIFEDRDITKKEAIKIWNDAKRKEGYSEDRLWTGK